MHGEARVFNCWRWMGHEEGVHHTPLCPLVYVRNSPSPKRLKGKLGGAWHM